jgi:hypothetical protein
MSGAQQSAFMNQRSFGSPPPGAIGSAYEGGFYAGAISTTANGVATHYLVIGPVSTAQISNRQWKNANTATPGSSSAIDGPQNTASMVADGSSTVYAAAHFCNDLVIGGFSDWYLPAQNELEVCYFNLKPGFTSNDTSSGVNISAVPSRGSNYTSGTPAQTSATAFQSGGAEVFNTQLYWSSTESTDTSAKCQYFSNGNQNYFINKNFSSARTRAVRRVPV